MPKKKLFIFENVYLINIPLKAHYKPKQAFKISVLVLQSLMKLVQNEWRAKKPFLQLPSSRILLTKPQTSHEAKKREVACWSEQTACTTAT